MREIGSPVKPMRWRVIIDKPRDVSPFFLNKLKTKKKLKIHTVGLISLSRYEIIEGMEYKKQERNSKVLVESIPFKKMTEII